MGLLQSFLSKKISRGTLTSKFFQLITQNLISTEELCARIEDQILPISDFYYTFKAEDFNAASNELYLEIDRYDPNLNDCDWDCNNIVYSESQVRSVIQKNFVPILQTSCDLSDSFFQPPVDLDQLSRRSNRIFIMSSPSLFTSLIAPI